MKLSIVIGLAWAAVALAGPVQVKVVTELPMLEVHEGHLFHGGVLWVARSRSTDQEKHRVEIYSSAGDRLDGVDLPKNPSHTPSHFYPFGPSEILVVGKNQWPWKTHYTVLSHRGGRIQVVKSVTFPERIQVDQFAGDARRMFFTEVGSAKIFEWRGGGDRWLKPEISGVGRTVMADGYLFSLERRSIYLGDENLVRVDLRTEKAERTFPDAHRNGLVGVELFEPGKVVAAEMLADQVLVVDRKTNKLEQTLSVPGNPRGLAQLGRCLVVGSEESREVSFWDLSVTPAAKVASWDLSVLGNTLRKARSVAVDPATGRVYVRSTYLCSGCAATMSSVAMAEDTSGDLRRACAR